MSLVNALNGDYTANIPTQVAGKIVYYYISSTSNSGKTISRPITAPLGRWTFKILPCALSIGIKENSIIKVKPIYPNPASFITCIPLTSNASQNVKVSLINLLGQSIDIIYEGEISQGEKNVFLHAENYPKGVYFVEIKTESNTVFQKLIIR
jgi:hypothetical protein